MASNINPKAVVSACPFNIHELLEGNDYVIPDYQRDFVWKERQVKQLWKNLREPYKRNTKDNSLLTSPDAYFLGTIVVLQNSGGKTLTRGDLTPNGFVIYKGDTAIAKPRLSAAQHSTSTIRLRACLESGKRFSDNDIVLLWAIPY